MAWPTTTITTTDMDAGTDSPAVARAQIKQMADDINAMIAALNAALGVAGLDASGLIATTQLPTIPANKGGTGQTAFTVGDIFFANTSSTISKLAASTSGYVLKSNGAGVAPSWQMEGGGLNSGTRVAFQQGTAPTGWTRDDTAAINDSVMRLRTGASVGAGGSLAFSSWAGQTTTGATTLTEAQIPSHTHTSLIWISGSTGTVISTGLGGKNSNAQGGYMPNTGATGGNGSHSHSLSQNLKYYDFIIAQKD